MDKDYIKAVSILNSMQTFIRLPESGYQQSQEIGHLMGHWWKRLGYSVEDLNRLNAVHIAGTKGKGSTCAITESVLRQCGLKTGLFTSPHLREVRERFRINGMALPHSKFVTYFSSVYNRLKLATDNEPQPGYFHFLTLMAFDVFLNENVDVAVIEVGIGGEYDATNLLPRPVCCGVSALGLDHTSILGDTVDKIAWHKAGIFKKGVPAFTQPQKPEALQVLQQRANEIGCELKVVEPLGFDENDENFHLNLSGDVQKANAGLALSLVEAWLRNAKCPSLNFKGDFCPTYAFNRGLAHCQWPGRFQLLDRAPFRYWIDGAHTKESIDLCVKWFFDQQKLNNPDSLPRVLLFSTTGQRGFEKFLDQIYKQSLEMPFSMAIFSTTVPFLPAPPDMAYNENNHKEQFEKCKQMAEIYNKFGVDSIATSTVSDGIAAIQQKFNGGAHVLVTGSLHLVGAVLSTLNESVN